mgnify:CR=1 FL=1
MAESAPTSRPSTKWIHCYRAGLSVELPTSFFRLTTSNLDSLKTVVSSLHNVYSPCDGSTTSIQTFLGHEYMDMLIDADDNRNSVVLITMPKVSFTKDQASVALSSMCADMFRGFNMQFISDSTGTCALGAFYHARFLIHGPDYDYFSTMFFVTSDLRSYAIVFNQPESRLENSALLSNARESRIVNPKPIKWDSYFGFRVSEGEDYSSVDSALFSLYLNRADTAASQEGGLVKVDGVCMFILPVGTEIQSKDYKGYMKQISSKLGVSSTASFWVQQKGANVLDVTAMKTYFRFTAEKVDLELPAGEETYTDQLTLEDLEYMNTEYKTLKTKEAQQIKYKVAAFDKPLKTQVGGYSAIRLGHKRTNGISMTQGVTYIIFEGRNLYRLDFGYRVEDGTHWEDSAQIIARSIVLF